MLVVDDNKVIRQLIRVNLELEGLEVVTAADGAECLDVVHEVRPDVVTLDVVMPRLDGLRTAARLRADPRTHHLPLAIISACTQYEVETGLDVGVDAFLAKPFEPAELVRLVKSLIAGRAGRQEAGQEGRGGAVLGGDGGGSRGDEDQAGGGDRGVEGDDASPAHGASSAHGSPTDGGSSANASSAHGIPSTHGCPAHGASSAHATHTHGTPPTQGVPPDTPGAPRDGGVSDGVPGGMPFGG